MDPLIRRRPRRRTYNIRRRRRVLAVVFAVLLSVIGIGLSRWQQAERPPDTTVVLRSTSPTPEPSAEAQGVSPASPTQLPNVPAPTEMPIPAPFFDAQRLTYEPEFYVPQVQAFLDTQPGPLKSMALNISGRRHSFAEALISQTSYYSANPKVVLALLESQSALLSTAEPSTEQRDWAIGFRGEEGKYRGIQAQVRWAVRRLVYARRDYPQAVPLTFADKSQLSPPREMTLGEYVLASILAPTTTSDQLEMHMQAFLATYIRLFGDPRPTPEEWPSPAAPFLWKPTERTPPISSFFDHESPFLTRQPGAPTTTYWGRAETDVAFAYDGHDGWDYVLGTPELALAAADGEVVFAGNADDNCGTRAVVIDHGNGYRTLYWHLYQVDVEIGQRVTRGDRIGIVGETGCVTGQHLHFGVQYLGRNVDPYGWCGAEADPWAQHPAGQTSTWLWADRPSPCAPPPVGAVVVDAGNSGFSTTGDGWQTVATGYGGNALAIPSVLRLTSEMTTGVTVTVALTATVMPTPQSPATATWRATLPTSGRYRVLAYVPYALSGLIDATEVRYRIQSSEGEAEVMVNQRRYANEWVDLGTYQFDAGQRASVVMTNEDGQARRSVWADAVMWLPAEEP